MLLNHNEVVCSNQPATSGSQYVQLNYVAYHDYIYRKPAAKLSSPGATLGIYVIEL